MCDSCSHDFILFFVGCDRCDMMCCVDCLIMRLCVYFFCVVYYTFYLNNKPSHVVIPRGHGGYLASSRDSVSKFQAPDYLHFSAMKCTLLT